MASVKILGFRISIVQIVFALGLFVRVILVPHPGFLADIAYWKWWTKDPAQNGLVHTITQTGINYPPVYLYVMKATGHVYSFFGSLNDDLVYWDKANLLFLFLIKTPYILADLTVGFLIFWFIKKNITQKPKTENWFTDNLALFCASLWLFNPGVIYDSALWGQTDSLGVLPILLAFVVATRDRPVLAGALAGASFFLKAQSIPLVIFLYLYLFLRFGPSKTIKAAAASTFTGITLTLPFLLGHAMDRIIGTIFSSVGYFPFASLYAFNLWWLVIKGVSFQFPDQTLVLGLLSYRTIGFTLFWSVFALMSFLIWKNPVKDKTPALFFSASLVILSAFLLPTEIHERYLLPFFAFFPIVIGLWGTNLQNLGSLGKLSSFILLSLSWLLNLHFVMVKNYPENELPGLSLLTSSMPTVSLWLSALNLIIFLFLLISLFRQYLPQRLSLIVLIPLVLLGIEAIPFAVAKSRSPILLTTLKPSSNFQGFGSLATNKSVLGNNLSTYYFFASNGLGTHANSQITYDINGAYKRLETDIGIDTDGTDAATVVFQIYGDEKILANSGVIKRWEFPKHLVADLSGVKKLTLVVNDAADGINGDHADWIYPTLYK